jgi:hypothetical protein
MLQTLYPASFRRYSSLQILGPMTDEFTSWLLQQRYTHASIRQRIWLLAYIEVTLTRRGVQNLSEIKPSDLAAVEKAYGDDSLIWPAQPMRWRNICVPGMF